MHTSGTPGLLKFCIQTHGYFRRMATAMAAALDLTPNDRVLAPLPLFHINPMGYGIITALLTGADAASHRVRTMFYADAEFLRLRHRRRAQLRS
jgi:carnitine-CoA ligase